MAERYHQKYFLQEEDYCFYQFYFWNYKFQQIPLISYNSEDYIFKDWDYFKKVNRKTFWFYSTYTGYIPKNFKKKGRGQNPLLLL